ncbi:hypothetical protein [Sulfurimonas sp.]|uniref:hypothetical protein n=1 Tax=Sulfurimonas sp. TaxID=2022749 RepID=UPI00356870B5
MKILISLLMLCSLMYSKQNVFMLDKYDKEVELEAKIVSKIASDSLGEKPNIYIPDISAKEKAIYSKYCNVSNNCKSANFIFDKKGLDGNDCGLKQKVYFTNNYKKLVSNSRYIGAFFWNKSRPNIVFVKRRLKQNGVNLSNEYNQYIEDFND